VKDAVPLVRCNQPPFVLLFSVLGVEVLGVEVLGLEVLGWEAQRCLCTMPCEAKAEAKVERKTRARADFIVKMIGLSNGQVAAVRGRSTTVSSSIPSAFICLS
jgi:hypothetical protein